ncbi:MAG: hypothetical protein M3P30_07380 [Chloroflexota bacterium]|nr:hypothetical protein [Chloroflexota bacterium]
MDARAATANNSDLWARYLSDQWSAWLDAFGVRRIAGADRITRVIAEAAAAPVAMWLTMLYARPIGRLYSVNAPDVTRFLEESAIAPEAIEIPARYAVRSALPRYDRYEGNTQREWSMTARGIVGAGAG